MNDNVGKTRWVWWVVGSILIATVPPLVWFVAGIDRDGKASDGGNGIHMRAYGIFGASNTLHIEGTPPPTPPKKKAPKDEDSE